MLCGSLPPPKRFFHFKLIPQSKRLCHFKFMQTLLLLLYWRFFLWFWGRTGLPCELSTLSPFNLSNLFASFQVSLLILWPALLVASFRLLHSSYYILLGIKAWCAINLLFFYKKQNIVLWTLIYCPHSSDNLWAVFFLWESEWKHILMFF